RNIDGFYYRVTTDSEDWVVVDRLTKSSHFLPIRKDSSVSRLAETFQQEIVRLHGTPSVIVSDRDPCFVSCFWKGNAMLRFVGIRLENVLLKDRRSLRESHEEQDYSFCQDSLEEQSRAGSHLGNREVYPDFLSSFHSMIWQLGAGGVVVEVVGAEGSSRELCYWREKWRKRVFRGRREIVYMNSILKRR
nr:RNA-directed DNA polymerase [Tanacetum cinerariifolium]